ncbi:hypothetical protein SAMN04488066_101150 [Halorubrum aquaticum]|uniref:DUF7344 domain-containing protein n=1 Tax=Halorubrum aquaticum TaxID=387340 RepID=A0A1I2Z2Z9_9EURY|nr:hypothetical protein [Halorubrum aquaticum]SFH31919.1 hypothetical protein SAMN04488066_101150 [Halorubrum aquaticum]
MRSLRRRPNRSAAAEGALPRETVFEILRNERRRHVLRYLKAHDGGPVAFGDLVEYVAARENDTTAEDLTSVQRKRVYAGLTQTHLPMLEDRGVIHYDSETGRVELTARARQVEFYLEPVPESRIPWSYYFLGLSLIGVAALVMEALALPPFDSISVVLLLGLIVLAFLISSAACVRETNRNRLGSDLDEE